MRLNRLISGTIGLILVAASILPVNAQGKPNRVRNLVLVTQSTDGTQYSVDVNSFKTRQRANIKDASFELWVNYGIPERDGTKFAQMRVSADCLRPSIKFMGMTKYNSKNKVVRLIRGLNYTTATEEGTVYETIRQFSCKQAFSR